MRELTKQTIQFCNELNKNPNLDVRRLAGIITVKPLNDKKLSICDVICDSLDIMLPAPDENCIELLIHEKGKKLATKGIIWDCRDIKIDII